MKMKILITTILIILGALVPHFTSCQNIKGAILKFSPLSLIDPYGNNYHFGVEFLPVNNTTFEADIAIYRSRIQTRKGFKIKPELRFYKKGNYSKSCGSGLYIANEIFFVKDNFLKGNTFIRSGENGNENELYYDYEIIDRFEIGDHVKVGVQKILWNRISIDSYFGLGVKYYNSKFEYRITDPICCHVIRFFQLPIGTGLRPSMTMGIKLGVRINNSKTKNTL